jgi:tetratricopeptide (TPR) repeat protein
LTTTREAAAISTRVLIGSPGELASALTGRGLIHRFARRSDEALRDLREAFRICLDLRERAMITWTASSLAKTYAERGDLGRARQVLAETAPIAGADDHEWTLAAEAEILFLEGDRDAALDKAIELVDGERDHGWQKDLASRIWWTARVLGEDTVGGADEVASARKILEELHYEQGLLEPELVVEASSTSR